MEKVTKCPIDNSPKLKKIRVDNMAALKCSDCGLIFLHPFPKEEYLKDIYTKDYYLSWGIRNECDTTSKEIKKKFFNKILGIIQQYKKKGRFLDIGCALGYMLEVAENYGYDAYGIDINKYAIETAKKDIGDKKVFLGDLRSVDFSDRYFDIICMFDLIEHIKNPVELMKDAGRILNDNGIIVILTPNTNSLSAKLMRRYWFQYKREHLFYFSSNNIQRLAENAGFKIVKIMPAKKTTNLFYVYNQSQIYPVPIISNILRYVYPILTNRIQGMPIELSFGEMLVILKKNGHGPD